VSGARPPACRECESWGAELALGLLTGPDRATGLAHLAGCPSCREQVDELARVADRLLLLAPEAEPPAGFESKVLAAVGSAAATEGVTAGGGGRGGRSRSRGRAGGGRRRAGLIGALVVAAAVGGGAVGAVLRSPEADRGPTPLRTGLAVSASGRVSCRVVVSGTRPASVLVSLDGYPGADADVTVEMTTVTGEVIPLGPVHVTGGHGLLVSALDVEAKSLGVMRMLDREGKVIYEATLHDHHTFTAY
jgi:hypothetical protein